MTPKLKKKEENSVDSVLGLNLNLSFKMFNSIFSYYCNDLFSLSFAITFKLQNIQYANIKRSIVCFKILFDPQKTTDANKKFRNFLLFSQILLHKKKNLDSNQVKFNYPLHVLLYVLLLS